jgi:hypothetical protein
MHRQTLVGAASGFLIAVVGLLVEGARLLVGLPHAAPTFWDRWQSPALWVGACVATGLAVSVARRRWTSGAAFFAGPAIAGAALGVVFLILDRGTALVTGAAAAGGIVVGGTLGALGALWWRHAP